LLGGLDGAAAAAAGTALQLPEVQPPFVGHHELAVQDRVLIELRGTGHDLRERRRHLRAAS
jgi:hypothetical protein